MQAQASRLALSGQPPPPRFVGHPLSAINRHSCPLYCARDSRSEGSAAQNQPICHHQASLPLAKLATPSAITKRSPRKIAGFSEGWPAALHQSPHHAPPSMVLVGDRKGVRRGWFRVLRIGPLSGDERSATVNLPNSMRPNACRNR
jgi:hypothetical protein